MSTAFTVTSVLLGAALLFGAMWGLGSRFVRRLEQQQREHDIELRHLSEQHRHRTARWIARCRCGMERQESGEWGMPDLFVDPDHIFEVACPRCVDRARRRVAS